MARATFHLSAAKDDQIIGHTEREVKHENGFNGDQSGK
jgi:hypothetical protein